MQLFITIILPIIWIEQVFIEICHYFVSFAANLPKETAASRLLRAYIS